MALVRRLWPPCGKKENAKLVKRASLNSPPLPPFRVKERQGGRISSGLGVF